MEQCRSVNPFMPTGVFNPFKLTGRSVIIGSLVCFIILQKLLYHLSKQRRPYQTLFHSPSALCLCWICTVCQIPLYNVWVLGIIWLLNDCSNNVEMSFLSALMVYSSVNNLSVISGRFINVWVKPVLSRIYKVSS